MSIKNMLIFFGGPSDKTKMRVPSRHLPFKFFLESADQLMGIHGKIFSSIPRHDWFDNCLKTEIKTKADTKFGGYGPETIRSRSSI